MKRKVPLMIATIMLLQILLPMLSIIFESGITLISRAEGDAQYINTAQDLWDFAEEVNNGNTYEGITVYLTADIDLGCSADNQWIPIGDYSSNTANVFKGTFDGQDHKISGIYIDTDNRYQGLFGNNDGTIKKFTVNNGQVSSTGSCTGVIAGFNSGSILEVINEVAITGGDNLGGICGRNYGEINSCQNNATINGLESITGKQLGGIAGFNSGKIIDSNNTGLIKGNERTGLLSGVGGIAGYNEEIIENCNNSAEISNPENSGGIVGLSTQGAIINCSNSAEVVGELTLGGIAGKNNYGGGRDGYSIIINCNNSGNVKSTLTFANTYVGGIAGSNVCKSEAGRAVIIKCQNSGLIEGSSYVGGLCGFNGDGNGGATSYIKKSFNTGNVKSYTYNTDSSESTMAYVGGVVGRNNCGYIEECYNNGNVEGLNVVGGVAGLNSDYIIRCYNNGEVKAVVSSENNSNRLVFVKSAGIASYNYGEIESCYNTGKVIASVLDDLNFGGMASGLVSNNVSDGGTIQNSYTTGQLEATTSTSIIEPNDGIATNCYYLDTTCNAQYEETQNQVIKSCTSNTMKTADFINTLNSNAFEIDSNNQNNGYPVLKEIQGVSITFEDEILYKKILEKLLHKIENYDDETMTIEMTQDNIDSITTLELDNNSINSTEKIRNINGIEKFTKLTHLDLAFNNISDISKLQALTELEYLSLEANNISNIDAISELEKLQTLYLDYNDITAIPSLNWPSLTYLDLSTNKLADISNLSSLSNLEKLYLLNYTYSGVDSDRANGIADITTLEELENLTTIDVRNQKFTQAGKIGEEIELPLIFSQAKNQESVAYTANDFIIRNCTLNGTKITLGEDTTRKATITINGGILSGSVLSVTVSAEEESDYEYSVNDDGTTITITGYTGTDTSITIPDNIDGYTVTDIGNWAFSNCKDLETVTIPQGIITIHTDAFMYCENLKNINVNENNPNYSSVDGVLFDKEKTYLRKYPRGKGETQYVIPNTVTRIESYAFYGCNNLKNIEIPSGVIKIWNATFENCNNLISIDVDENNPNYSSVDGVLFDKEKSNLIVYPANKEGTEYVIPTTVATIESYAFENCKNLISIEIPEGITGIYESTFYGCSNLMNVRLPNSLTKIDRYAFFCCDKLTSIKIPSNVINIDEDVFNTTLTIICNDNSNAEKFAIDNGISYAFVGDANGDNEINFMDILAINKHRLGKTQLTGIQLEVSDVTGDGNIDFMDILQINKYRLGKTDSL